MGALAPEAEALVVVTSAVVVCAGSWMSKVLVSSAIAANKFLRVNTRRGLSVDKMAQKWHLLEKPWNSVITIGRAPPDYSYDTIPRFLE